MRGRGRNKLLVAGILGASMLLVVAGLALLLTRDGVPRHSRLQIRLAGELPEEPSRSVLRRFFGGQEATVLDVVQGLDAAAGDHRVQAVLLRLSRLQCGLGRAQEVREAVLRYREQGGFVAALVEQAGLADYYVAAAADQIYLLPGGSVTLAGLAIEVPFVRGTLDRFGVVPDFETVGEHKDSPDVYTRKEMPAAMRANLERITGALQDRFMADVARDRKISPDRLEELVASGFFHAESAREANLVDGILHQDEVEARLQERAGHDLEDMVLTRYVAALQPGWFSRRPRIAVVHATGILVSGESVENDWTGRMAGSETLSRTWKMVRDDDQIRAVVFRIDSPGGSAAASEVIWRQVALTAEKKPVVVSLGDYGASGAYFIAAAGDEVMAEPGTLTGSIGVYAGKFALRGLWEWAGMNWQVVKGSENADMFADLDPWTAEQRRLLRRHLLSIYDRFLEVVMQGRQMDRATLEPLATGRVFTGEEARELGLVDAVGGLHDAIAAARERAGLDPLQPVRIDVYPRPAGWLSTLTGEVAGGGLPQPGAMGRAVAEVAAREALARERVLYHCPYRVVVP